MFARHHQLIPPAVSGVIGYTFVIAAPLIFGFSDDDRTTAFFVIVGIARLGARRGDPLRTRRADSHGAGADSAETRT